MDQSNVLDVGDGTPAWIRREWHAPNLTRLAGSATAAGGGSTTPDNIHSSASVSP
jgi:hypothetical protein